MQENIKYTVDLSAKNQHIYNVTMSFFPKDDTPMDIYLPAWIPGSYMIRDFAKNIITIACSNAQDGTELTSEKLDKQTWRIYPTGQPVRITYQVYAFDLSVRTAYLDDTRGFFNGTSLFLTAKTYEHLGCDIEILASDDMPNWQVATGLQRGQSTEIFNFGLYHADNYDELIDCPVEIGDFDIVSFSACGIPHYLILSGKHYADLERVKSDLIKICEHQLSLFTAPYPMDEYWFLTNIQESGFGGLEHRNSTVLVCGRYDFPFKNDAALSDDYKTFLSLCSHEYFHTWNVKRIKPATFMPYQLDQESYTTQLWAYEGFTSYYDDFVLYRAGIINQQEYLTLLAKTFSRVYRGKGRLKQSVTESSFDAWTKFYKQAEDAPNNIVSYYAKGGLIALYFDLLIIKHSNRKHNLDNVMKALWKQHGEKNIGTEQQDITDLISLFATTDLSAEIDNAINTTQDLPFAELLKEFGVTLQFNPSKTINSLESQAQGTANTPYLGFLYKTTNQTLKITNVFEDSPAEQAGIAANDDIIAIDGVKVTEKNIENVLKGLIEQSSIECHLFRDNILMAKTLVLDKPEHHAAALTVNDEARTELWLKAR
ncbi:M61 family metallopeptidase [Flocculibacter collagenilyticus]|uniref:M61 family metallopeptidase n=1 Tax=Flocculibacter collagenilyticus TaxID=2744479 RepID=UPI0018F367AD|nr:PDZ domain-containing protein [Flocculibacter collagenilyticus]